MSDAPLYDYPFDEFSRHYEGFSALPRSDDPGPMEATASRLFQYLRPEFGDEEEFTYKANRFLLIMSYMAQHLEELDDEDFAVKGSDMALVGSHLLWAVHHVFTTRRLSDLGCGPSLDEIKALARERKRELD
jgi:hypothetical protein